MLFFPFCSLCNIVVRIFTLHSMNFFVLYTLIQCRSFSLIYIFLKLKLQLYLDSTLIWDSVSLISGFPFTLWSNHHITVINIHEYNSILNTVQYSLLMNKIQQLISSISGNKVVFLVTTLLLCMGNEETHF